MQEWLFPVVQDSDEMELSDCNLGDTDGKCEEVIINCQYIARTMYNIMFDLVREESIDVLRVCEIISFIFSPSFYFHTALYSGRYLNRTVSSFSLLFF